MLLVNDKNKLVKIPNLSVLIVANRQKFVNESEVTEMITDSKGNKLPQPRTSNKVQSRNVRMCRVTNHMSHSKFCGECGYRVRGTNHIDGSHHLKGKVIE